MNAIPPVSRKHQPRFSDEQHRTQTASAYQKDITAYDQVRPSYPAAIFTLLDKKQPCVIVDLGCGTGILTGQLAKQFHHAGVLGVDPSRAMLTQCRAQHPALPLIQATAEDTALAESSVDLITCAQTWHWVDHERASVEADRIARPGAQLLLVWNTIDVSHAWAHRLTRIMHSGDTLAAGFYPTVSDMWLLTEEHRSTFTQALNPAQVHLLMHTRSYWQNASDSTRAKMTANLDWYLHEHLGYEKTNAPVVEIPYRTDAFVYELASETA